MLRHLPRSGCPVAWLNTPRGCHRCHRKLPFSCLYGLRGLLWQGERVLAPHLRFAWTHSHSRSPHICLHPTEEPNRCFFGNRTSAPLVRDPPLLAVRPPNIQLFVRSIIKKPVNKNVVLGTILAMDSVHMKHRSRRTRGSCPWTSGSSHP